MVRISVNNLNGRRRISLSAVRKLSRFTAGRIYKAGHVELNIVFTGNSDIRRLNRRYRSRDSATDVLCFSMPWMAPYGRGEKRLRADIYISSDKAVSNSRRFKTTFREELYIYVVHGILHAFGYRDGTGPERERMERLQGCLVAEFMRRKNFKYGA